MKIPEVGTIYRAKGTTESWKRFRVVKIEDNTAYHNDNIGRTALDYFFEAYEEDRDQESPIEKR